MTFLEAVDADTLAPAKPWAEDVECDVCGAMGPKMEYLPVLNLLGCQCWRCKWAWLMHVKPKAANG